MSVNRPAIVTCVLALVGLAIAADLAYLHAQLGGATAYTSWCDVNGEVGCTAVLTSDYAYFLGVPIASWALFTYAVVAAGALALSAAARASRRRQLATALFAIVVWSVLFSVYLASVSWFVLGTVCLLCSGLYVVNLALLVATARLFTAVRMGGREQSAWQDRTRVIAGVCGAAVVLVIGVVGWKAVKGEQVLTAEEIKQKDPEFYSWYTTLPTVAAEPSGGHTKGQPGALVTLAEFSDFECGHCANAYRALRQVLPRYQKDVQIRFHHFPLDPACNPAVKHAIHQYACLAAMASECAAAQNRFWEYHDLLFENQPKLDRDSLIEYAQRVGLDRDAFLACLDSDAPRQAIARDVAEGMRLGIESTPTLFLNGRIITGAPRADALGNAIQIERASRARNEG
jgi:protein-disulfide isomerase